MSAKLTPEEAKAAAQAITTHNYDYAGHLLEEFFQTLTRPEAKSVLHHVGRYAEKCGQLPPIPWEEED